MHKQIFKGNQMKIYILLEKQNFFKLELLINIIDLILN